VIYVSKNVTPASPIDTKYIYIFDNYFHDGNMNFIQTGDGYQWVDQVYVYNNVFKGAPEAIYAVIIGNGTLNIYFYNNTFYLASSASEGIVFHEQGSPQSHFANNIFYGYAGQTPLYLEPYKGAAMWSDHDLFFNQGGTIIMPDPARVVPTHAVQGNPLFTNAAGADWSIQPGSPAKDAGSPSVSSIVTTDYLGIPAHREAPLILGRSNTPTATPAVPPAPTGLSILRNP